MVTSKSSHFKQKNVISLKKYLQSINRRIYVHIWSDSSFSYSKLQCACCQTSLGNRFWGDWRVWWMITINRGNPALRSRAAFWVKYQMSRQETIFFSIIWQQRAWKRRKPGRKFLLCCLLMDKSNIIIAITIITITANDQTNRSCYHHYI